MLIENILIEGDVPQLLGWGRQLWAKNNWQLWAKNNCHTVVWSLVELYSSGKDCSNMTATFCSDNQINNNDATPLTIGKQGRPTSVVLFLASAALSGVKKGDLWKKGPFHVAWTNCAPVGHSGEMLSAWSPWGNVSVPKQFKENEDQATTYNLKTTS